MFKKRETDSGDVTANHYENNTIEDVNRQKVNTILKGSKLTGDINISYDLELSGEVEGNINSEQNSNIIIKGTCRGNIKTNGGKVVIDGTLSDGDIISGSDVRITGKCSGGTVEAKGKIYINGEFDGKFQANEIEVGPDARGQGELLYNEFVSISKGAKIEAQIHKIQDEIKKIEKKPADMKVVNLGIPAKESTEIKEK